MNTRCSSARAAPCRLASSTIHALMKFANFSFDGWLLRRGHPHPCPSPINGEGALLIDLSAPQAYVPPLPAQSRSRPPPPRPRYPYRTRAARPPVDVIVHGGDLRLGRMEL